MNATRSTKPSENKPKQIAFVLDANAWISTQLLRGASGDALLFAIQSVHGVIGLPQVVEQEVRLNMRRLAVERLGKVWDDIEWLERFLDSRLDIDAPDETRIESAISKRFESLAPALRRIPFRHRHALRALERVISHLPPSDAEEQFRDSAIWEATIEMAQSFEVRLVTHDKAFFEHKKPASGPAAIITDDAKRRATCPIHFHATLEDALKAIHERAPPKDRKAILGAIAELAVPMIEEVAVERGYRVGAVDGVELTPFPTKVKQSLAVSFELNCEMFPTAERDSRESNGSRFSTRGWARLDTKSGRVSEVVLDQVETPGSVDWFRRPADDTFPERRWR